MTEKNNHPSETAREIRAQVQWAACRVRITHHFVHEPRVTRHETRDTDHRPVVNHVNEPPHHPFQVASTLSRFYAFTRPVAGVNPLFPP